MKAERGNRPRNQEFKNLTRFPAPTDQHAGESWLKQTAERQQPIEPQFHDSIEDEHMAYP